jgi:glyoxylase-like metal-dependent hydrolase (beta-lactamase superfamily II)
MKTALISILTLALCAVSFADEQETGPFTRVQLTEHLFQLSTDQGEYTTNTLVSVGEDGVLIVDTQAANFAEDLKKEIERFGKGSPKIIINTHRHVEHIGGNAIFGSDPIVIAHDLVPTKLRSGSYLFEEFPAATFPDITFKDKMSLFFNGERIDLIEMAGSHDDNEIIVHFTDSKIVHLSSLVNGFNFPSIDRDGDALAFPSVVGRALEILPPDVVIVSGHNENGSVEDLAKYHLMLIETIAVVRQGLTAGKEVKTLQREKILEDWSLFAGSYVSCDEWIAYVAEAIENEGKEKKPTVIGEMYYAIKENGAAAAMTLYEQLKKDSSEKYDFRDVDLLVVGLKLAQKKDLTGAILFLEKSADLYPESEYLYYVLYQLGVVYEELGDVEKAIDNARKASDLQPENQAIRALLERLENPSTTE